MGTALGFGAYRKWTQNELSWKLVGAWAGVVGLFAVGDYYVSQVVHVIERDKYIQRFTLHREGLGATSDKVW